MLSYAKSEILRQNGVLCSGPLHDFWRRWPFICFLIGYAPTSEYIVYLFPALKVRFWSISLSSYSFPWKIWPFQFFLLFHKAFRLQSRHMLLWELRLEGKAFYVQAVPTTIMKDAFCRVLFLWGEMWDDGYGRKNNWLEQASAAELCWAAEEAAFACLMVPLQHCSGSRRLHLGQSRGMSM